MLVSSKTKHLFNEFYWLFLNNNKDALKKSEKTNSALEKELYSTKIALEDAQQKVVGLENNLTSAYK